MGFVSAVFVNEQYAAVLSDGKCILHKIEAEVPYEKYIYILKNKDNSHKMNKKSLIYQLD